MLPGVDGDALAILIQLIGAYLFECAVEYAAKEIDGQNFVAMPVCVLMVRYCYCGINRLKMRSHTGPRAPGARVLVHVRVARAPPRPNP
jgi:hypothetical protein